MNIKKIATLIAVGAVALVVGMPSNVSAATIVTVSNNTKIKALNNKLKKLPNGKASFQNVKSLVTKLSKLDPKKAATYYKTGLKKLASSPSQQTQAKQLATQVTKIVKKSDLPAGQANKINKTVNNDAKKVPPYVPPYQAFVPALEGLAIA